MSAYAIAILLCYALAAGWVADRLLIRAKWVSRHPRHALFAWHASAVAYVSSLTGATLLLAHDVLEQALVWLLHADKSQIHLAYAGGRSVDGLWNGAIVVPITLTVSGLAVVANKGMSAERRRRQFRMLAGTSAHFGSGSAISVVVIEHAVPVAHCLPGRKGQGVIVFSSAALANLTSAEVEAVLEHERAHLRLRHHRMVLVADTVAAILDWTGALRSYPAQVRRLVELDADDVAVMRFGHHTVASALLAMCTPPPRPASEVGHLSFAGTGAAPRIRRLLASGSVEDAGLRGVSRGLLTWSIPMALLLPPAVVLWPAASLVGSAH